VELLLGPMFTALATALGAVIAWAIRDKAKIELSEANERLLQGVITGAVGIAEEAARSALSKGVVVTPQQKLETAQAHVLTEVARLNLPKLQPAQITSLIHAQLGLARIVAPTVTVPMRLPSTLQTTTPVRGTPAK
jgi:hypothetical protein